MFEEDLDAIRASLNTGGQVRSPLKDAVDAFDTIGRNYAGQLCNHVLMTSQRRTKWERANFAQFGDIARDFKRDFDIDMLRGVDGAEVARVIGATCTLTRAALQIRSISTRVVTPQSNLAN
jgi:hypothetical protein